MKNNFSTRDLALLGLLLTIKILLGRYLSINLGDIVRISFAFIANGIIAYLFGPWISAGMGAMSDVIGFFAFPSKYGYFPGYTLSAALSGFVYGYFLYHKKGISKLRLLLAISIVNVFCNLFLGTVWTSILMGKSIWVLLPARALKNILLIPVEFYALSSIFKYLSVHLKRLVSKPKKTEI